jgi:DNA-binding transcriptional regulator YdaS (Cro superfamily)
MLTSLNQRRESGVNHPLARALRGVGMDAADVAARLGVDPKTVGRWMAGRVPYERNRAALARLTGWSQRDLWPSLGAHPIPEWATHEVRVAYPHRSAVPADSWRHLFEQAEREIGVLAYSGLFLAEDVAVSRILRDKAQSGIRVRLAMGDPAGERVAKRGTEEGIGASVMMARAYNSLALFRALADEPNTELRLHDTILYNSIYFADDDLLINTHVYGCPASHGPVFHVHRSRPDGMAETYVKSFEAVWSTGKGPCLDVASLEFPGACGMV